MKTVRSTMVSALVLALAINSQLGGVPVAAFTFGRRTPFISHGSLGVQLKLSSSAASFVEDVQSKYSASPSYVVKDKDEIKKKREDLKVRLLEAADNFKALQVEEESKALHEAESDLQDKVEGRFPIRFLRRIVSKILRRRTNKKQGTVIRREAFAAAKLEVGEVGGAIIALAEELAKYNPTKSPNYGWQGYAGGLPLENKLEGRWKLRFTTAADATFKASNKRGSISTLQEIDATQGTLTNVVDFERGKLQGIRVVVAGKADADDEMDLNFRRVEILRNSRFKFFRKLVFPIPAQLFRAVNRYLSKDDDENMRGPYFQIQYLDDDLRMHKTGEGNWFIQSRLE